MRALACLLVAATLPVAVAGADDPKPMPGVISECCEAPPFCLEFEQEPRLAVRARATDVVAVDFRLARRGVEVERVLIAGRAARVERRTGTKGRGYRAVLAHAGLLTGRLEVGRRYLVRIDVRLPPAREMCLRAVTGDDARDGGSCTEGCPDTFHQYVRLHRPR